jgi:hypothetical protein
MPDATTGPLRVDFVIGVTPDKWARTWAERRPDSALLLTPVEAESAESRLRSGSSALSLLRLPVDRAGLHVIPLYEEQPVVMVAREHAAAAFDELDITDLIDEVLLQPLDTVPGWRDAASAEVRARAEALGRLTPSEAVAVAAAGSGFVVVPLSVARALQRKDVVHRPVTGVDGSTVALAWRVDDEDPRIEDFVGVVRGRTARSSRGRAQETPGAAEPPTRGTGRGGAAGSGRAAGKDGAGGRGAAPGKGGARHTSSRGGGSGAGSSGGSGARSGRGAGRRRGQGRAGR